MYPYHGSLSDINEDNPWGKVQHKDDTSVLLRSVEPQSVDDAEYEWGIDGGVDVQ
jgi:hypothetical protein